MTDFSADAIRTGITFIARNGLPSESAHLFSDKPLLHEHFELYFVKAGDVAWLIENEVHPAPPRSLILFNNREIHKLQVRSNQRFERMMLFFDPGLVAPFEPLAPGLLSCFTDRRPGEGNVVPLDLGVGEQLLWLFSRIGQAGAEDQPGAALIKLTSLLEILQLANRAFAAAASPDRGQTLPGKAADLLRYIDAHLAQDLSLETLSREFGLGRHYLCRLFKRETGSTLHNYIVYKRVAAAKRLLDDGLRPAEVVGLCGFGSAGRFAAAFKQVIGFPPSVYQKKNKSS